MKAKLLKKLRQRGRDQIYINSYTERGGCVIGMNYSIPDDDYRGLFDYGDTPGVVKEKAARVYISKNIDRIRKKYRKYSVEYRK